MFKRFITYPVTAKTYINEREVAILPEDENVMYQDTDGMFGGDGGEIYSLADIKQYWNDYNNDDMILVEYHNFMEWFNETSEGMQKVEGCDNIQAYTESGNEIHVECPYCGQMTNMEFIHTYGMCYDCLNETDDE